jgi:hypothetical protein
MAIQNWRESDAWQCTSYPHQAALPLLDFQSTDDVYGPMTRTCATKCLRSVHSDAEKAPVSRPIKIAFSSTCRCPPRSPSSTHSIFHALPFEEQSMPSLPPTPGGQIVARRSPAQPWTSWIGGHCPLPFLALRHAHHQAGRPQSLVHASNRPRAPESPRAAP